MASKTKNMAGKGRGIYSTDAEIQRALTHHRAGRLAEAEEIYRRILKANPRDADALHLLGVLSHQRGLPDAAVDLIGRAIRVNPAVPYFHDNMGNALKAAGRFEEAIAHFKRALSLQPDYAAACNNLGITLRAVGRPEEAVAYYRKAIEFQQGLVEGHNNLGNALKDLGRLAEAVECYKKALELKPDYPDALTNMGSVLQDQGLTEEAIQLYHRAIALEPRSAEAFNNLGIALEDQGRTAEAVAALREAIQARPTYAEAYNNLGNALKDQGMAREAVPCYLKAMKLKQGFSGAHSNCLLTLHYDEAASPAALFEGAVEWGRKYGQLAVSPSFPNAPDPNRLIRIGYVSGDFRRHPVAHFIRAPLSCHNRDRFEVYLYANQSIHDSVTEEIRSMPVTWRSITGLSDEEAERVICADGIDILVDLSGHTAAHRLTLFARRPAPVQATWLGYSDTTGLAAIDYIIADPQVIPEGDETFYVERVVRLPHTYLCYTPVAEAPEVGHLPSLSRGFITFGSFNNVAKVSGAALMTWAAVLRAVPGSRMCVKTSLVNLGEVREKYLRVFAEYGVEPGRVEIAGKSQDHKGLLAFYGNIDIALDTFPYGGTTTTAEALMMGVPVVTLKGENFVGRVGWSMLSTVGLGELVAGDRDEYVRIASALAADTERLASYRAGLRGRLVNSPLCDAAGFTVELETAYRAMWRAWCAER